MNKQINGFGGLNRLTLAIQSDGKSLYDALNVEHTKDGGLTRRRALKKVNTIEALGVTTTIIPTAMQQWAHFYQDGERLCGVITQRANMATETYTPKLYNSITAQGYSFASEPETITATKSTNGEALALVAGIDNANLDVVLLGQMTYLETRLPFYDTSVSLSYRRNGKAYSLVRSYADNTMAYIPKTRSIRAKRIKSTDDKFTDLFFDGLHLYVGVETSGASRKLSAAHVDWGHAEQLYTNTAALAQSSSTLNAKFDAITQNNCLLPKIIDDVCVVGSRAYVTVNRGELYPAVASQMHPGELAKGRILYSVINNYGNFTNDGLLLDAGFMPDVTGRVGNNKRLLAVDSVMFIAGDRGVDVWSIDPDPARNNLVNTYKIAMGAADDWCEYSNGVLAAGSMGIIIFSKSLTNDDYGFQRAGVELGDLLEQLKKTTLTKVCYLPKSNEIFICFTTTKPVSTDKYVKTHAKGWTMLVGSIQEGGLQWTRHSFAGVIPNNIFEVGDKVYFSVGNNVFEYSDDVGFDEYYSHNGELSEIKQSEYDFDAYIQTPFYYFGDNTRLKQVNALGLSYKGTVIVDIHPNINKPTDTLGDNYTMYSDATEVEWTKTTGDVYVGVATQSISFNLNFSNAKTTVYGINIEAKMLGSGLKTW